MIDHVGTATNQLTYFSFKLNFIAAQSSCISILRVSEVFHISAIFMFSSLTFLLPVLQLYENFPSFQGKTGIPLKMPLLTSQDALSVYTC